MVPFCARKKRIFINAYIYLRQIAYSNTQLFEKYAFDFFNNFSVVQKISTRHYPICASNFSHNRHQIFYSTRRCTSVAATQKIVIYF